MKTASDAAARRARVKKWAVWIAIRFGILLILLIPTYIGITTYIIQKNAPKEDNVPVFDAIDLVGPTGAQIAQTNGTDTLLSLFLPLFASETEVTAIPATHSAGAYTATMHNDGVSSTYRFFFSPNASECYFTAPDGKSYVVAASEDTERFLNSSFSFELYAGARVPTLTTAATDEVIPTAITWYYRTKNGSFTQLTQTGADAQSRVYPIANDVAFYFSILPDAHEVVIREDGNVLYRGAANGISLSLDEHTDFLDVEINATYAQRDDVPYFGTLSYAFRMEVVEAARFTPAALSVPSGDFFIIRGENVKNADKLEISVTPTTAAPIVFEKDGAVYVAFPAEKAGSYTTQITYGTIAASFELIAMKTPTAHHVPDAEFLKKDLDYAALLHTVLPRLIHDKGADTADTSLVPRGNFATYSTDRIFSFGDTLTSRGEDLSDAPLTFDLYQFDDAVTALSAGRVKEIGVDEHIGKYVIIDHGCGLYTWYAGLSEYRVSTGDNVSVGQEVGIASTTLCNERSALVMATLGKASLSIEALSLHGFGWKQPETV